MSRAERPYSRPAYLLGASLRHRFTSAGAVAWLRGLPRPSIRPGDGRIHVGDVALYPGVHLACGPEGEIRIGDGTYLNRDTRVWAERSVRVGEDCMIAWDVILTDTDGFGEAGVGPSEPVEIGDRVWIGAKAVVLGGARIGDGAVVGAGAVVRGEIPPGAIVVGRPGHPVRSLPRPADRGEAA